MHMSFAKASENEVKKFRVQSSEFGRICQRPKVLTALERIGKNNY